MIAALFVSENGPYINISNIIAWTKLNDARRYFGPHRVIAHPPCERWGRYWSGGPSAKIRRKLGDDGGCFKSALDSVRTYGGVLEHPAASHAFKKFRLLIPDRSGGWSGPDRFGGMVCHVEQGNYGHLARKATWLYAVNCILPELIWGPSVASIRLDEGFRSSKDRKKARRNGIKPLKRLSKNQRIHTPLPFRDLLISIAESL